MKKLSLLGIALSLVVLSGCITIFEKYTIHANGTGTMEYIIDMTEMYEMMASFSDSSEAMESPGINESLQEAIPGLNEIEGISNVAITGDGSEYIAGIKFDFKNADALNLAIGVLFNREDDAGIKYVALKGKTFTRFNQTSKEFNKEELLGSEELDEETMKMILESMKYNISVSFDKNVKKVTTKAPYTMEDKNVLIETNFSEIFNNEDFLKTIIKSK